VENVEFGEVEVVAVDSAHLTYRLGEKAVAIPALLIEPGTTARRSGDRGTLVISRWAAIGLGLVLPLEP
jgi:hypothetical protein